MAQSHEPNISHIKAALVSSGVLKSATLSEAEQEKIKKELAAKGVVSPDILIVCNSAHYCIIIRSL
jgi:hypothetical protein